MKQQAVTIPLTGLEADTAPPVEDTVARRIALDKVMAEFKRREQKILLMLGEGYTTVEIAEEFDLTASYTRELVAAIRAKARGFLGEL